MKERKEAHPGLKWPPSTDYWGDLWPIVVAHSQNPWMKQDEINLKAALLEGFRVILACWVPFSWLSETFFCMTETPARILKVADDVWCALKSEDVSSQKMWTQRALLFFPLSFSFKLSPTITDRGCSGLKCVTWIWNANALFTRRRDQRGAWKRRVFD